MNSILNQDAQECLFLKARSHTGWQDKPVSNDQLRELPANASGLS